MSDIKYNLQFYELCRLLELGEVIDMPKPISGGLLHRMFEIQTSQGKYAVKVLNPQIMLRPTAMQNFIDSEMIVNIAAKKIPALPAKKFRGSSVNEVDGQFYLVFDWLDAKSLKLNEINITHCERIGGILADIHRTDFSELGLFEEYSSGEELTNWSYYQQKGQQDGAVWSSLLHKNIENLYAWNNRAVGAAELLASTVVISHRDLDPKNVMWYREKPVIIDWESAGFVNPMFDFVDTALYWAEDRDGRMNRDKFRAFANAYKKKYKELEADWQTVLDKGFLGKLGWLVYSLKRSLWIECTDAAEQRLGTEEVIGTINALNEYANWIPTLEAWLCDACH